MKCQACGTENPEGRINCEACGAPLGDNYQTEYRQQVSYNTNQYNQQPYVNQGYYQNPQMQVISPCNRWLAFVLCLFLGYIGIHRFYVGKVGTGLLYVFTCGLFGIGTLVDLILIAMGSFTDKAGLMLKE